MAVGSPAVLESPDEPREDRLGEDAVSAASRRWLPLLVALAFMLPLALMIFYRLTYRVGSDIQPHVQFVREAALRQEPWPSYFLYHVTVYAVALFRPALRALRIAAVLVLVAAVAAKAYLSYARLIGPRVSSALAALATFGLLIAMPLPNWWRFPQIYIGQLTPNVWHNPTTIFSLPFAILLFYVGLRSLKTLAPRDLLAVSGLAVVTALAKPSYLTAFVPAYGVALLWQAIRRLPPRRALASIALVVAPAVAVLALQYVALFGQAGQTGYVGSKVTIAPLYVWHTYSKSVPASIALSLAFPLSYSALYFQRTLRDGTLKFAWAVMLVATVEFALFAETGGRAFDGNFVWAAYSAAYILFLATMAALLKSRERGWRKLVVWALFAAQAATGVFYIFRLLTLTTRGAYF